MTREWPPAILVLFVDMSFEPNHAIKPANGMKGVSI